MARQASFLARPSKKEEKMMPPKFGPRASWILIGLLGGCAGAEFTEADREQTKTVDLGSTFCIALPSTREWAPPVLKGGSILFLHRDGKESDGTTVFQFQAEKEGVSEIVIRAQPPLGADRDFSMRVLVIEPDYGGESAFDDEWWERRWSRDRD
jgi:hypothetical protein